MNFFSKAELHAPQFLTEKRSIFHFLALVTAVSIIFWIVYRPIGKIGDIGGLWGQMMTLYTAILVATGLLIMSLSRVVLYNIQRRIHIRIWGYIAWLLGEWAIIVGMIVWLAQTLNTNEGLSYFTTVSRTAIFVTAILIIPYVISILLFLLREKKMEIAALEAMIKQQVPAQPQMNGMMNFYDRSGHLTFGTKRKNILYIASNDNYTNIYYLDEGTEACHIHHCSMKQVEEGYANQGLLRCHRKFLVNTDNVKLMRREDDGLVLELIGTETKIPVSKTYIDRVTHYFAGVPIQS